MIAPVRFCQRSAVSNSLSMRAAIRFEAYVTPCPQNLQMKAETSMKPLMSFIRPQLGTGNVNRSHLHHRTPDVLKRDFNLAHGAKIPGALILDHPVDAAVTVNAQVSC